MMLADLAMIPGGADLWGALQIRRGGIAMESAWQPLRGVALPWSVHVRTHACTHTQTSHEHGSYEIGIDNAHGLAHVSDLGESRLRGNMWWKRALLVERRCAHCRTCSHTRARLSNV